MKTFCPHTLLICSLLAMSYACPVAGASAEGRSIGEEFHQQTSLTWTGAIADLFQSKPQKQPRFKTIPSAKTIRLPYPRFTGMLLEEAIQKRRSVREFSKKN